MENILFSCLLQVVALEDLDLFFICVHEKNHCMENSGISIFLYLNFKAILKSLFKLLLVQLPFFYFD